MTLTTLPFEQIQGFYNNNVAVKTTLDMLRSLKSMYFDNKSFNLITRNNWLNTILKEEDFSDEKEVFMMLFSNYAEGHETMHTFAVKMIKEIKFRP